MKTLLQAAGLAAWLAMSHANAGISLNGTRVIFDGAHPEASVTVRNHGADILVQSWLEALDGDKAELPFAITPPLTRLPAGQEQLLRILYAGAGASDQQETAFWLNVQEIPQAAGKGNVLQLAVRQRVKVFYRPPGLDGDALQAPERLRWRLRRERGNSWLQADNPSRYHVTVTGLTLLSGGKSKEISRARMLAPDTGGQWSLPADTADDARLRYQIINDFGASQAFEARLHGSASVQPQRLEP
ncbi:fimbrial biogenesis chaperone [Chromobacterium haemolyticum]|uniref:fimbrial biogenesis chaperone n=1 Tax=Chromobacterium haemolyticum TaxID=394935 RepID=UPI0009DA291A|nr:molecular chaperone [Chromobacterium haemolyticum]OQS35946.1 hypothetical protein B0T39_17405 [Chromobacterium haemolyticum]